VLLSMWLAPLFVVRYTVYVLPAFWLIVARAIAVLRIRYLQVVAASVITVALAINLPPLYGDPFYSRPDLRSAVLFVLESPDDAQLVIHTTEFTQLPFLYYDRGSLDEALILPGDRASLRGIVADRPGFWYVANYDVQDPEGASSAEQQATEDPC